MRGRTLLLMTAVSAAASCGWSSPELETRTFRLQHMSPQAAVRLIEPYVRSEDAALATPGGDNVPAITVRETPDALDRIAAMLAEYDQPQPTVTLHFQVIEANGFETSDPAIADVEAALRELFRFRGYRLAAEGVVMGTAESTLRQPLAGAERWFLIEAYVKSVAAQDSAGAIQLAVELTGDGVVLETTVGVQIGQTMVIGTTPRLPRGGEAPGALILTVRPELPDSPGTT